MRIEVGPGLRVATRFYGMTIWTKKELGSSIHYYHIALRSYDPHQQRLANAYALQFQSQPQQQLVKWKLAIRPHLLGWAAGLYH